MFFYKCMGNFRSEVVKTTAFKEYLGRATTSFGGITGTPQWKKGKNISWGLRG